MKHLLIQIMIYLLLGYGPVWAIIGDKPDHTFQWNKFNALLSIDNYIIGSADRGVVVTRYDTEDGIFKQVDQYFTDYEPVKMRVFDNILVVKTLGNQLLFFDILSLPKLELLYLFEADMEFYDYVFYKQDLFLSARFNGLFHYRYNKIESFDFIDSNITGILISQLEIKKDTLYALDEYNGIMRFDVSGGNLDNFINYFYIPRTIKNFLLTDTNIIMTTLNEGLWIGQFNQDGGVITDTISGVITPQKIFDTDTFLVLVTERQIDLLNKSFTDSVISRTISNQKPAGTIFTYLGENRLALPNVSGGFSLYDIDQLDTLTIKTEGLNRPGEITELFFFNGDLYTCGNGNPIDIYAFDIDQVPFYDTTISGGLRYCLSLDTVNNDLFALYSKPNIIAIYSWVFDDGPAYIKDFTDSIEIDVVGFPQMHIADDMFNDTLRLILIINDFSIDLYTIHADSLAIEFRKKISYTGRIEGYALIGNVLYVVTNKKLLYTSVIDSTFSSKFISPLQLNTAPYELSQINSNLTVFTNDRLLFYDYSSPDSLVYDTSIVLDRNVLASKIQGDSLYAVGNNGISVFDISGEYPILVDSGGLGGKMIDVFDNIIAVSNGFSFDIYYMEEEIPTSVPFVEFDLPREFELLQNYPNPFNASTVLSFQLEKPGQVNLEIYNTLGQKVSTVLDNRMPAGLHRIEWSGNNMSGDNLASGVYLYRLVVDGAKQSKKMVLLK